MSRDNWFKSYQFFDNEYDDLWWENINSPSSYDYGDEYFQSSAIEPECEHDGVSINQKWYCKHCEAEVMITVDGWRMK